MPASISVASRARPTSPIRRGRRCYDWALAPRWVAGVEAAGSLASSVGSNTCLQHDSTTISSDCRVMPRAVATFTGRLGWTPTDGRLLLYSKGGLAWMRADATITPNKGYSFANPGDPTNEALSAWGWTAGAGLEYAVAPGWSVGVEYGYLRVASGMSTPDTISTAPPPTWRAAIPA